MTQAQPLIETLPMTLGTPISTEQDNPSNIEIPLQIELPNGQALYTAVVLGGLHYHGQQQIAERITTAWNAFVGVPTLRINRPTQCLHQIAEPATQRLDAKRFLSESDYEDLWHFEGMTSDGEGYDISKERMKRLAELGVVRWFGKDRYGVTAFGQYVLKTWTDLPLETYAEANARCNAEFKACIERLNTEALARQAKQGEPDGQ
ncbi:hypothetical protein D3C78_56890 [compost metagenome]